MTLHPIALLGILLATHVSAHAQLYKWKDADGTVHYSNNALDAHSSSAAEIKVPPLIDPSTPPRVAKDWREQEADSKKRRELAAKAAAAAASAPHNPPYAPRSVPNTDPRNVPYNTPYGSPGTVIVTTPRNVFPRSSSSAPPNTRYEDTAAGKCRQANAIIGNKSTRVDGKPTMQNDRDAAANDAMAYCR